MLLYSKEELVILEYKGIPAKKLGVIFTLTGLVILLYAVYRNKQSK